MFVSFVLCFSWRVSHVRVEGQSSFLMGPRRGPTAHTWIRFLPGFFTVASDILVFGALHSITSALIRPGFAQLLCTRSWKPSQGSKPGQPACCSTWLVVSVFKAAASCFVWWLLLLNLHTLSYLKVEILKWAFLVYGLLLLLWLLLDEAKVFCLWSANFSVCLQYLCAYGIEAEWTEQRE